MGKVESALLDLLTENRGALFQSELVRQSGFSKSRVSEVISSLEQRRLVSRTALGKNLRVFLPYKFHPRFIRSKSAPRKKELLKLGIVRSSEYPYLVSFKKILGEKLGIVLDLVIYSNGIDLARDLSLLRLDLGIAPILTHFIFCSLGSPMKIIAPAGSGGSSIVVRRLHRHNSTSDSKRSRGVRNVGGKASRVATTKLSTMELLLRSTINCEEGKSLPLSNPGDIIYSNGPNEFMQALISGKADGACTWEPYTTMLLANERLGLKRIVRYSDIGEHICCALAGGNSLQAQFLDKLGSLFVKSQEEYLRDRERFFAPYSVLMGFDQKIVRKVSSEYSYPSELDQSIISKQFTRAGIQIPSPWSVKEILPS
jgi:predicted transcriptional regulator